VTTRNHLSWMLLLAALAGSACGGGSTAPNGNPPDTTTVPKAITVAFASGTVRAELATLSAQRSTGLSNRASLAADSGMVFVWSADQNPQTTGFWMQNTHFDLDIAFVDANKRVINIDQMTKETLDIHRATAPFRYALEAPKGWFAAHGVAAGATAVFSIPPGVLIDP
jgi:uncharacterized membrane protein (UPF0127 family)